MLGSVMQSSYQMTAEDKAELAEIEAAERDVKLRRRRFFAKLRQRALRARRKA
jgi:hypothetical protein